MDFNDKDFEEYYNKVKEEAEAYARYFDSKEEFKIKDFGWYKNKHGDLINIIYKLKNKLYCFIGIYEDGDRETELNFSENGFCLQATDDKGNLVEYLGAELPKKPRMFEFEDEIIKNGQIYDGNKWRFFMPLAIDIEDNDIGTKWKITMEEILE